MWSAQSADAFELAVFTEKVCFLFYSSFRTNVYIPPSLINASRTTHFHEHFGAPTQHRRLVINLNMRLPLSSLLFCGPTSVLQWKSFMCLSKWSSRKTFLRRGCFSLLSKKPKHFTLIMPILVVFLIRRDIIRRGCFSLLSKKPKHFTLPMPILVLFLVRRDIIPVCLLPLGQVLMCWNERRWCQSFRGFWRDVLLLKVQSESSMLLRIIPHIQQTRPKSSLRM